MDGRTLNLLYVACDFNLKPIQISKNGNKKISDNPLYAFNRHDGLPHNETTTAENTHLI